MALLKSAIEAGRPVPKLPAVDRPALLEIEYAAREIRQAGSVRLATVLATTAQTRRASLMGSGIARRRTGQGHGGIGE